MKIIITGGAGFIGANAASRYLRAGHEVIVVDNLSREGSQRNLEWLQPQGRLSFVRIDLRDGEAVRRLFGRHRSADRILHLAGQVAVTTSVINPREDFEINALGTLNVLEAMRSASMEATAIYSSTNKVYGEMRDTTVIERDGRYEYGYLPNGISEAHNLDFHSPYGCSKGAADQYFIDYHRIYGLRTVVFRQSCIYGYRQFGVEDQGWVAWFLIASQLQHPITIYGDGKQVRDVLFIDDLLDAYDAAFAAGGKVVGKAYNIGGGLNNAMSLRELLAHIERRQERRIPYRIEDWRPGDQAIYVSDIRRAQAEMGWAPAISSNTGVDLLYDWVAANLGLFGAYPSTFRMVAAR